MAFIPMPSVPGLPGRPLNPKNAVRGRGTVIGSGQALSFLLLPFVIGTPKVASPLVFNDGIPPLGFVLVRRALIDASTGVEIVAAVAPAALNFTPRTVDAGRSIKYRVTVTLLGMTFSVETLPFLIAAIAAPVSIAPSAQWTGVDGSGGAVPAVTGTAQNSDPVSGFMTTVACVGNFINPPGFYVPMVSDHDVHVMAYAEGGIASVTFSVEGNTIAVADPVVRAVTYGTQTRSLPV